MQKGIFLMKMNKLGYLEKLSFKLTKWIGNPYCLILHTFAFGGLFILRLYGVIGDLFLLSLIAAVCIEAIYLIIFNQMMIRNNTKNMVKVQAEIESIQEGEEDVRKSMINILHLAHQMKKLQIEVENLKKNGFLKRTSRNGQRAHI